MSNSPASMTANSVYNERAVVYVRGVDPASNRANHSHKWTLATYLDQVAGRGDRVPVHKRPFVRNESHYENGPILV